MLSRLFKPLNIICVLCYILFMGFAFNSKIVDALVLIFFSEVYTLLMSLHLTTRQNTGKEWM